MADTTIDTSEYPEEPQMTYDGVKAKLNARISGVRDLNANRRQRGPFAGMSDEQFKVYMAREDGRVSGLFEGLTYVERMYRNAPSVAVMLVPVYNRGNARVGLMLVRRGLQDGYGKLALPGGFQMLGETWQEAGVREVLEETGVALDAAKVNIWDVTTAPNGINLIFGIYGEELAIEDLTPKTDSETLEVVFTMDAVETAFPLHTDVVKLYFDIYGPHDPNGDGL